LTKFLFFGKLIALLVDFDFSFIAESSGDGVARSESDAFKLFQLLADKPYQYAAAVHQLGRFHLLGLAGLPKNLKGKQAAIRFFQQAIALCKHPESFSFLGKCYLNGDGVVKNEQAAYDLFLQGVEADDPESMFLLAEGLVNGLTSLDAVLSSSSSLPISIGPECTNEQAAFLLYRLAASKHQHQASQEAVENCLACGIGTDSVVGDASIDA
jgi:TPR repeat protein